MLLEYLSINGKAQPSRNLNHNQRLLKQFSCFPLKTWRNLHEKQFQRRGNQNQTSLSVRYICFSDFQDNQDNHEEHDNQYDHDYHNDNDNHGNHYNQDNQVRQAHL